jgi:hypothetical protein
MRSISFLLLCAVASAGPVEFGLAQYNAALDARNLKVRIKYDVSLEPAESFRIEPYAAGGAHITGGDLRGLMYALLEAADQIRATGRLKQTHSVASIAIRAVRRFARDNLSDWQPYFEMLARDRFNRFTLIYTEPPLLDQAGLEKLRTISQLASDYGVDFTLALWYPPDDSIEKIVKACPLIRSIQIREPSHDLDVYRTRVFKPLRSVGHRIALDPDPEIIETARAENVALPVDPHGWPPNFEIEAPVDYASHGEFYWLWGRLGYDSKTKPAHSEDADEIKAAAQIVNSLAISRGGSNEWAAFLRPGEVANSLAMAAAEIESSKVPDLQLLAKIARDAATKRGAAAGAEESPISRPAIVHTVVHSATPDQTINLTLQIAPITDLRVVRLHYRALTASTSVVMEKPAGLSISFAIPPQLNDLLYYFEFVDKNDRSWIDPDPLTAMPYHIVRVQAPVPLQ